MKKRKNKFKVDRFILLSLLSLAAIILISYFSFYNEGPVVVSKVSERKNIVVYPSQYSDQHITENAISTDEKFKNIVFFDNGSQIANTISALPKPSLSKPQPSEKGTWLWTPVLQITPEYMDSIISGAKNNGILNIYLSIDSYLDIYTMDNGPEKDAAEKKFSGIIEKFITLAHKNNITVDVEGGWRNWAEPGNFYKPYALMDYALNYNLTHTEKIRGFQYDIEPYLLDNYEKNKESILKNFILLVHGSAKKLANSSLDLSVVIPDFYDKESGQTPAFLYGGKSGYTFDHLLSVLENKPGSTILIMSYRNFSEGNDGSIDISKNEVEEADESNTRIVIAQETGEVSPTYLSFYNTSRTYYLKQMSSLEKAFSNDKSFGGIATHYINAYMELH